MNNNINKLISYFESGDKCDCIHNLGVEIEHFIVFSDTNEAIPYEGDISIVNIIKKLAYLYGIDTTGISPLLGFSTDDFNITLEPACQFEISIMPRENIIDIEIIYDLFRNRLESILKPLDLLCFTVGYQPKSKVTDLNLIPKKRYEFMDKYFKTSGLCGINMMRGTASTQVSIDYSNESDFRQKIQAAYFLSPYLKLLTDNSPYFEGNKNNANLIRSYIWDNVDSKRSGIIPGVMSEDFGFKTYADYLWHLSPIFMPDYENHINDEYTFETKFCDIIGDKELSDFDIEHIMSMAFFDIRVKKYIEIRVADSLPKEKAFAYFALIKGLLYNKTSLDYISDYIRTNSVTEDKIINSKQSLVNNGWNGMFYDIPVIEAHNIFYNMAINNLKDNEKHYLYSFKEVE